MNIDEMKDRIARAEEIQRYTENRCEALEKENAELKEKLNIQERVNKEMISPALDRNLKQLTKAKEIIKEFLSYHHSNNYPYQMLEILGKAEQFLKGESDESKN